MKIKGETLGSSFQSIPVAYYTYDCIILYYITIVEQPIYDLLSLLYQVFILERTWAHNLRVPVCPWSFKNKRI